MRIHINIPVSDLDQSLAFYSAVLGQPASKPDQTTLPAGDYVVVVNRNDVKSETPMAVKAGERAEIHVK